MDSREAAERARLAETFLFRGAPPEAVELARTDPRTVRQENGKGGVIYAPHAFRRCLGVVLEGRVQVNKGALIMSVLEPGDLFGAAALFNDRADYATTLTARAPCRVLLLPQALVETEKAADDFGRTFAERHCNDAMHYFVGAGNQYGSTYSYAMCYWEEQHWLRPGDVVEADIQGIGTLQNRFV